MDVRGETKTLMVLDFDDTLVPTTWFKHFPFHAVPDARVRGMHTEYSCYLDELAHFISLVNGVSHTVVVCTRSTNGWVKHISDLALTSAPTTRDALLALPVEEVPDGNKRCVFRALMRRYPACTTVFGMSDAEKDRTDFLAAARDEARQGKHVLFVRAPSLVELKQQLRQMNATVQELCARDEPVDLRMVVTLHLPAYASGEAPRASVPLAALAARFGPQAASS